MGLIAILVILAKFDIPWAKKWVDKLKEWKHRLRCKDHSCEGGANENFRA